jgi:hypothetical protein
MNKITQLTTDYLRASRTIETYQVSHNNKSTICYVYNYEGTHFRLFNSVLELISFWESGTEPEVSFDSEEEMDEYLLTKQILS